MLVAASIAVGVALFIAVFRWADLDLGLIGETLAGVDPWCALSLVLSTALHFELTARKWALTAKLMSPDTRHRTRFYSYTALIALLAQVLPLQVCTTVVRSAAMRVHDRLPLTRTAVAAVFDQGFDLVICLLALIPLSLALAGLLSVPGALALAAALLVAVGVLAACRGAIVLAAVGRFLAARVGSLSRIHDLAAAVARLPEDRLRSRALGRFYWISAIRYGNLVARFVLVAWAIGSPVPGADIALVAPAVLLSFVLALTPMGLGIAELGWVGLLAIFGSARPEAMAYAVAARILIAASVGAVNLAVLVWRANPVARHRA
jgi:uncharacterized membrane protein YbhN (UPF0104 family)